MVRILFFLSPISFISHIYSILFRNSNLLSDLLFRISCLPSPNSYLISPIYILYLVFRILYLRYLVIHILYLLISRIFDILFHISYLISLI